MNTSLSNRHGIPNVLPLSPKLALFGSLTVLLLGSAGCKFSEPEPSADIYLSAVAPLAGGSNNPKKVGIASGQSRNFVRIRAKSPAAPGLQWEHESTGLYYQANGDVLRLFRDGKKRALIQGACRIADPDVFTGCSAEDAQRAKADAVVGQILTGVGLESLDLRSTPYGLVKMVGTDSELRFIVSDAGVTGASLVTPSKNGQKPSELKLFVDLFEHAELKPLEPATWTRQTAQPRPGDSRRVNRKQRPLVCVPHAGGIARIGGAVRQATDRARALRVGVRASAGVYMRRIHGQQDVCVVAEKPVVGTVQLPIGPVWRTWHRGSYGQIIEREAVSREKARRAGQESTGDWVAVLYQDPSHTKTEDLWSQLDTILVR